VLSKHFTVAITGKKPDSDKSGEYDDAPKPSHLALQDTF
jgi:hypothetical protein